jgi:hypothetical protein
VWGRDFDTNTTWKEIPLSSDIGTVPAMLGYGELLSQRYMTLLITTSRGGEVAASLLVDVKGSGTIYVAGALVDATGSDGNSVWQLVVRPLEYAHVLVSLST